MKFPYAMLRDFVETDLDAERVGDLLTMAGFELEGIDEVEGDQVLDIKVTSNRGDGLSVLGLAREVLAKDPSSKPTRLYDEAVRGFPIGDESESEIARRVTVKVETDECPRYACRLFIDVQNQPAPDWIQKRLRQAGQRPLGVLVDLTNYVMLELGQPLHAFDFDKVGNEIVVRGAKKGEKVTTLNGVEHELKAGQMMICDPKKPVATPGIMGGLETEVTDSTRNVLLESANFQNTAIRKLRKELGLATEASYRFERSVDPEGVVRALNRFAKLLEESGVAGSRVPGVVDVYRLKPTKKEIEVGLERTEMLLGLDVTLAQARNYLERLGFTVSDDGQDTVKVVVPAWRPDVLREDDVIEEIGRVHGYEKIPEKLPQGSTTRGGVFGLPRLMDTLIDRMLKCGFDQMINYSLRGAHPLDQPIGERLGPRNPHSPESALLRNSLLPGLAENATRNGGKDVHLFEVGRIFGKNSSGKDEWVHLGMLSTGALAPSHWVKSDPGQADFFSLKGVLETILSFGNAEPTFVPSKGEDPRFHPRRRADVEIDGQWIGMIGQLHPDVAESIDLPAETYVAEVAVELLQSALEKAGELHYHPISRNPAVRRDIAVLISKEVPFRDVEDRLRKALGEVGEKIWLFDVYEGKGIPEGHHSLAIALQLRKFGENFTDEEANQVRDRAARALEALGGKLR
jgi:phenylalanyl-tRNA synthetase beta chain